MIQSYDTATTKWSDSTTLLPPQPLGDSTGVAPMEIDRVKGGKQNGKGKQKGKDGSKGKSKGGKDLKGKGKNLQGQWTSSTSSWTSPIKEQWQGRSEVFNRQGQGQNKGQRCRSVLQLWSSRPPCQRLLAYPAGWKSRGFSDSADHCNWTGKCLDHLLHKLQQ